MRFPRFKTTIGATQIIRGEEVSISGFIGLALKLSLKHGRKLASESESSPRAVGWGRKSSESLFKKWRFMGLQLAALHSSEKRSKKEVDVKGTRGNYAETRVGGCEIAFCLTSINQWWSLRLVLEG